MHNNIRSSNLLLDSNDYLKVVNFDNTIKSKFKFDDCQSLYARVFDDEDANKRKTFECYNSRIKQFAIDLIFYYITRKFKLYNNE